MLYLVPRFMAWKLATAFILTAETWLGPERTRSGEEAVLAIGVSRSERLGVIRRIRRTPGLVFMPPEWLRSDSIDEQYSELLPSGQSTVPAEEAMMLAEIFGEDGELSLCADAVSMVTRRGFGRPAVYVPFGDQNPSPSGEGKV
jgi:hypothetical protein